MFTVWSLPGIVKLTDCNQSVHLESLKKHCHAWKHGHIVAKYLINDWRVGVSTLSFFLTSYREEREAIFEPIQTGVADPDEQPLGALQQPGKRRARPQQLQELPGDVTGHLSGQGNWQFHRSHSLAIHMPFVCVTVSNLCHSP